MREYHPILGSRQLKKIDVHKPLSILHIKKIEVHTIIVSSNTTSQLLFQYVKMTTTTMSVCESSLVSQYLDSTWTVPGQTLVIMGQTISFSLTCGSTICFIVGTNLLHLSPISNYVPCNSKSLSNVKKNTHRFCIESTEVPIKETAIGSVYNQEPSIPVGNKDELHV